MLRPSRLAALLLLVPALAAAHEVLHDVDRGRSVAVRAYVADGAPLAHAPFAVFSPAEPDVPWQTGQTDRHGWAAFVPDAPGRWRVRVADATGHGVEVPVDVGPGAVVEASPGGAAVALRPLAGAAAVAVVFAALFVVQRRRRGARP